MIESLQDLYDDAGTAWSTPRIAETEGTPGIIDHWANSALSANEQPHIFVKLHAQVIVAAGGAGSMAFYWISAENAALTTNATLLAIGNNEGGYGGVLPVIATLDIPIATLVAGYRIFDSVGATIKQQFSGIVSDEVGLGVTTMTMRAGLIAGGQHGQPV